MELFRQFVLRIQRQFLRFEKVRGGESFEFAPGLEPIFIVGAPRSGSTFFSQVVTARFQMGYISNLMALVPLYMGAIASRFGSKIMAWNEIRKSDYGYISGLHSPNEAGKIQTLWFENELTETQRQAVRKSVWRVTQALGAPLQIKNLNNSTRIANIVKVFPEAKFIYLTRDTLFNAQSLLRARMSNEPSIENWWSTEPRGFEKVLKESPWYQVVWQVAALHQQIEADLQQTSATVYRVNYKELCQSPKHVLDALQSALTLTEKPNGASLDGLAPSEKIRLPKAEWAKLEEALQRVQREGV